MTEIVAKSKENSTDRSNNNVAAMPAVSKADRQMLQVLEGYEIAKNLANKQTDSQKA